MEEDIELREADLELLSVNLFFCGIAPQEFKNSEMGEWVSLERQKQKQNYD